MNGMVIKTQNGTLDSTIQRIAAAGDTDILAQSVGSGMWNTVAAYKTEAARDRAWKMLENAIASGLRLFRFPSEAEMGATDERG
jgi:hypothetical protein